MCHCYVSAQCSIHPALKMSLSFVLTEHKCLILLMIQSMSSYMYMLLYFVLGHLTGTYSCVHIDLLTSLMIIISVSA